MTRLRAHPHEREIVRLAVPAFGALVAEPLYVLVDTAVVGHLGTPQLGGLGVASAVLITTYAVFIFLAYGTTGAVARLLGAGQSREAARQGVQGIWLAASLSLAVAGVLYLTAPLLVGWLGAEGAVRANALVYLRISTFGLPALFVTMAGTGYLRGLQDTRTPLVVAVVTSVVNLVVQLVLIHGFDQGIGASALSTVLAQSLGAASYLHRVGGSARSLGVSLRPDVRSIRRLAVAGRDLMVRTAALRGSLVLATAVATRMGDIDLAAHQVNFELWSFLALGLDAIAIAGQAITGRLLGAADPDGARAAGRRIIQRGVAGGFVFARMVLVTRPVLPHLFTDDPAVISLLTFLLLWLAVLQPVNAVAFVLDGILIGAGDLSFMAKSMVGALCVFAAATGFVVAADLGIGWLWGALGLLMLTRAATLYVRFERGAWAVVGSSR